MDALTLLKQDHQEVAALFREFEDATDDDDKTALAGQVCQLLTVHAQIEEELLYPAAREALDSEEQDLIDEATVEHASVKDLVRQIESVDSAAALFAAKVTVLCEYVTHHVKEEESELFPKLEKTALDLEGLGVALTTRKVELMKLLGISADDAVESETDDAKTAVEAERAKQAAHPN